jgi:hypothetical protein
MYFFLLPVFTGSRNQKPPHKGGGVRPYYGKEILLYE